MTTFNGLPAHILLVHAVVVLLPLAAGLLVLTAVWPSARRRLAGPNALLSLVVLGLVPITTDAGEWLERRVPSSELLRDHTELGDTALFVTVPVVVLALIVWWRGREETAVAAASPVTAAVEGSLHSGVSTATLTRPVAALRVLLAPESRAVTIVIAVFAVLAAGGAVYDIYRIGDSGAKASWTGNFSSTPSQERPARSGGK